MTEQPTTVAGRAAWSVSKTPALRDLILAIEVEMYDLASNEGYHSGIADCKEHDPAHAINVDLLARALEELAALPPSAPPALDELTDAFASDPYIRGHNRGYNRGWKDAEYARLVDGKGPAA